MAVRDISGARGGSGTRNRVNGDRGMLFKGMFGWRPNFAMPHLWLPPIQG
jgi:hypothetical protein